MPGEIHEALVELRDAGYNRYHRDRERYSAAQYFPPIDNLRAAGYTYRFVAGYLVTLGIGGKTLMNTSSASMWRPRSNVV